MSTPEPAAEPVDDPPTDAVAGSPGADPGEAVDVGEQLEDVPLLDEAPQPAPPHRPWYPGSVGGFLYLGVLAATAIGVYLVSTHDWRLGVRWEGGSLIAAAEFRLVLPGREAGVLAVRHRLIDCLVLAGCGAALVFLAATIAGQPQL